MLAHSPPLPIVIDYIDKYHGITAEEEAGITLALQQRDRVRRIRLDMLFPDLKRLVVAIDGEFPVLEYLYVAPLRWKAKLVLDKTFRAPRLRHLVLATFAIPIRAPLLVGEAAAGAGLVTLALQSIHSSVYFGPDELLRGLLVMLQLERLVIDFDSPVSNRDVVHGQPDLLHTPPSPPVIPAVTLPNLRSFAFRGVSAYLEALLPHITAPRLEKLHIRFFNQLSYSLPRLVQFVSATENLAGRLGSAVLRFNTWGTWVVVYPRVGARTYALFLCIHCRQLDWQVAFAAQALSTLNPVLSAVVHLSLEYQETVTLSEWHSETTRTDRAEWRKLLGAFRNVKTLSVHGGLVWEISRSLQVLDNEDDGEPILDLLLPELDRLEFHGSGNGGDAFAPFIEARNNAGRPVTLVAR